jgi:hypothetical protein
MMHWNDPEFTGHASDATDRLDQGFTKIRSGHFPPESLSSGVYPAYPEKNSTQELTFKQFGSNYPRLVEVKNKYDPNGLFGKVSVLCNPRFEHLGIDLSCSGTQQTRSRKSEANMKSNKRLWLCL